MVTQNAPLLIYTTFESVDDARSVARELVSRRLAACANILPGMTAVYEWKGEMQEAGEVVMIIKTCRERLADALQVAKELHPYETPALITLEPAEVDADFARWITGQTTSD